jgi:hypothetical protein
MQLDDLKTKLAAIFEVGIETIVLTVNPISDSSAFVLSLCLNQVAQLDTKKLAAVLALAQEASMDVFVHPEGADSVCVELRKENVQVVF